MIAKLRSTYQFTAKIFIRLQEDKNFKHGAAISYYTIFSLPAILIIIIGLTGSFLGREKVQSEIETQIESLLGPDTAREISQMIEGLDLDENTLWATLLGVGTLIFGATGVFYTLQDTLNTIWRIPHQLERKNSILKTVIDRVMSLAMVLTVGFILTVSMVLETAIVALKNLIENLEERLIESLSTRLPGFVDFIEQIDIIFAIAYTVDFLFALGIITTMFTLIFRFLPSSRIPWKDAWLGAFVTAVLFSIGKAIIGWYIGSSNVASAYGAAGSVVLILVWVYYSSQILLFGAEFIYVYTEFQGREIKPAPFIQRLLDRPLLRISLWARRWWRRIKRKQKKEAQKRHMQQDDTSPEVDAQAADSTDNQPDSTLPKS